MKEQKYFEINIQEDGSFRSNRTKSERQSLLPKSLKLLRKPKLHTLFQREKMKEMESLEYQAVDNIPLRLWYTKARKLSKRNLEKVAAKWVIYGLLGIVMGGLALGIKKAVAELVTLRLNYVNQFWNSGQPVTSFIVHYLFNLAYVSISCVIVLLFGAKSGSSGIPEVKGYLNGVRVVGTVNLKTFIGKVLSIIFSYSSSLALGPEGPMVHIGAIVGAGLAAAKSRTLGIRLPRMFESLRNDRDQRDFIASGAAAGITAAFGTPIGGVLFALEETSSWWSRELTWRTLFACMISAFTVNIISQIAASGSIVVNDYGLLTFGFSRNYLYHYEEMFPFIFLGIMGGLVGSLFIVLNVKLNKWRRDTINNRNLWKYFEVVIVITITAALTFGLPQLRPCEPLSKITYSTTTSCDSHANQTQPITLFCKHDHFNDLSNLFMQPAEESLKLLYNRNNGVYSFASLSIYLCVYFFMVAITSGISVASGLFVPLMLVGASLGRIVGQTMQLMFPGAKPPIDPSIYALVGSTAVMSGFSRITISLCVIIVELTENTQYLLPIMAAVMCAKWIGDAFTKSIYDELMELKSIPFVEHHPPHSTQLLNVTHVMARPVVCLHEIETVGKIIDALASNNHNGFPVISYDGIDRPLTYKGFILRKQLLILLDQRLYHRSSETRPGTLDQEYVASLMNRKAVPLETIELPPLEARDDLVLDLRPYMDRSHIIVQSTFSFMAAYLLFKTQGLRHLPVVDDKFQVIGIITRHDLLTFYTEDFATERPRTLDLP